ncbi:MAG TPA: metal-dependent phosphohydrolase [Spirochaeta sp.]|nr:metal-dependent phosphohydrolase [Spirochaeta sp.]
MKKNKKKVLFRNGSKYHIKFQISLLLLIFLLLGISTFTTLYAVLSINRNVSKQKAEQLFTETGHSIKLKLDNQLEKAVQLAGLMTTIPDFRTLPESDGTTYPGAPFIIEALRQNSYLYSIYTGYESDDFFQIIKTSGNLQIITAHNAPENTEYIYRTINSTSGTRQEYWSFADADLNIISRWVDDSPDYSPTTRPWFKSAISEPDKIVLTEPYIYNSLKKPGITAAAAAGDYCVAGIDITLADLKSFIDSIVISPNAGILILDGDQRVLAANPVMEEWLESSDTTLGPLKNMNSERRSFLTGEAIPDTDKKIVKKLNDNYLRWSTPWQTAGGQNYNLTITAPASDFLEHQEIIQRRIIIIALIIFALFCPVIVLSSMYLSRFLEHLADDAERIRHFIFSGEIAEHSPISEFEDLAEAFRVMKKAIAAKTQALEDALQKLERIIELGIAMSIEKSSDRLVDLILRGAKELSGADGGSLYLKGEEGNLDFKIVLNDSLGFAQGGVEPNPITMPPVQLYMEDGEPNFHNVVSATFHKAETIVIDDAYEDPLYDFSGTKKFDKLNDYRSTSFLTVPLKLQGSDIIGALQLINCTSEEDASVVPFSKDIQSFIEALSGLAAAILYNRNLLDSQDALFESLIQLTASAIDTKSPYTGGHCERVPVLAQMLADKAEEVDDGPLANFRFDTAIERKAFQVGSWLHDAGKMTTPEFVVDKAVKLETINNRIHEIRTRFEVLLRDARLREKEVLLSGGDPVDAAQILKDEEEQLHADFEFIARCNIGEEEFSPAYAERLLELSRKIWLSHFNHSIGLSREESEKLDKPFIKGETVEENLLADKPFHLIPDKLKTSEKYRAHGFILPESKYLYNRGEIYNLMIKQGTLTEEERFKINEHIMQTIIMLEELPFPSGMTKIPEFVGTHHETLIGTGYPRGLKADQLSIPSRIMTIADIFEALTASDRPYKEAKPLSEAVEILYQNALSGHIDPELFRLFLTTEIYRKYADRFLPDEQIDEVDIEKYLN